MSHAFAVTVNGRTFKARAGERLLDAALSRGVNIPHDCRSGRCGTCKVKVESGLALGGESNERDNIHACQAFVVSDLEVSLRSGPPVSTLAAQVAAMRQLSDDVIEVVVALNEPPVHRPGQYYQLTFKGYPSRPYSPTQAIGMFDLPGARLLRFHVKQLPNGAVSAHLGKGIRVGHKVRIDGPYGDAYLDDGESGRLVLVASGTGFAPIWAIADAALSADASRRIVMRVGVKERSQLYMQDILEALHECTSTDVAACVGSHMHLAATVPDLEPLDIVHVAGAPQLVDAVTRYGQEYGVRVKADAFVAADAPRKATSGLGGGLWKALAGASEAPREALEPEFIRTRRV